MTILRASFWIAVVAVLMPHDPDLGLGGHRLAGVAQGAACTADLNTCIHSSNSVEGLRELIRARVLTVKADLAATMHTAH